MEQVSTPHEVQNLFMEPKLPDFDKLAASDEVFPNLPALDINDLPPMDVTSDEFRMSCASASILNQFLDTYKVSFEDRMTLVKGVLAMAHGIAANTRADQLSKEKERYLAQGGKEYYGMYL